MMEQHRIVDFQVTAPFSALWVVLDSTPSDAWTGRLDGALDDGAHRVRPAVTDGDWVYLRVDEMDEPDALSILAAYVDAANRTTDADATARRLRVRPPRFEDR